MSSSQHYGRIVIDTRRPARPRPSQFTWLGDIYPEDAKSVEPLRFRLGELFIVITAAAVLLAVFRAMGIFGAVFSFITALAFTNQLYPTWRSGRDQEAMFDFIWGIVMPIVCLVFDPFIFKLDQAWFDVADVPLFDPTLSRSQFSWISAPAYIFIVVQWICLASLLIVGQPPARLAALLSGLLAIGFLFAGVLGVLLFFPSVLGLFAMGIGLLGFTPLFTARAYYRRTKYATALTPHSPENGFLRMLGAGVALVLPLFALLVVRLLISTP